MVMNSGTKQFRSLTEASFPRQFRKKHTKQFSEGKGTWFYNYILRKVQDRISGHAKDPLVG
ncbi:hypothetical protein M413DRAFT_323178 [Hebeloma cylindrosporum]|uniref:Uncharacterized protein n=1 Tax=Hebeloma cylindrosporum TaxID=76867 RepID=A0A0C3BX24_HEBCY|nr:hypothetical protein M413DRAFT_323178 [Hebeloma cylindrosporum h7]